MIDSIYSRHYRSFRQYYNTGKRTFTYYVKLVNFPPEEVLERFEIIFKPIGYKTCKLIKEQYLHDNPFEFTQIPFGKVYTYELVIDGAITVEDMSVMIFEMLGIEFRYMEIYRSNDPVFSMKEKGFKREYNKNRGRPDTTDLTQKTPLFSKEGIEEYVQKIKNLNKD